MGEFKGETKIMLQIPEDMQFEDANEDTNEDANINLV